MVSGGGGKTSGGDGGGRSGGRAGGRSGGRSGVRTGGRERDRRKIGGRIVGTKDDTRPKTAPGTGALSTKPAKAPPPAATPGPRGPERPERSTRQEERDLERGERFAPKKPGGLSGLPLVAIVGRPNVGKSTLFNRLARQRLAIVHDEPGVTRDRHYADTSAFGRGYTLIDTGGFDPEDADPMKAGIATHVRAAIAEADAIVFITDGTTELTSADRAAVKLLRQTEKPTFFAANKVDSKAEDAYASELYRLGVKHVYPVSALHGRGIGDLEAAVLAALPPMAEADDAPDPTVARVAVVGRPNAGKSSLLNRLLGEERMLVDERPGTTRDSIDTLISRGSKKYVFIDTAGIRKKGKVTKADDGIESMSVMQAIRAMERAEVVVVMCDAKEGVAEQDAKILGLAADRGRAMIIALNKTDLMSQEDLKRAEELARDKTTFAPYVPIVRMSVKTGRGVGDLLEAIDQVRTAFTKRITTGELNRFFEKVLDTHPPPTQGGRAPRLYYVTQAETSPPTFVAITNFPEAIHFSYRRFVVNQLRKHFGFEGAPVRIFYKPKRKRDEGAGGDKKQKSDEPTPRRRAAPKD